MLRSAWFAQELLTTFEAEVSEVALSPSRHSGTFKIFIDNTVIWDRSSSLTRGFPELKDLKQRVRDQIAPEKSLGHSDNQDLMTSSSSLEK